MSYQLQIAFAYAIIIENLPSIDWQVHALCWSLIIIYARGNISSRSFQCVENEKVEEVVDEVHKSIICINLSTVGSL